MNFFKRLLNIQGSAPPASITSTRHDDYPPIVIQIPREAVESGYVNGVVEILESFTPSLLEQNRNRVRLEVLGYSDDPRELYDIHEVKLYFKNLFERYPGIFYWIDIDSYMLMFLGLMFFKPIRQDGIVRLSNENLQEYLRIGFAGLNHFCNENSVPADPTTQLVLRAIKG